MHHYSEKRDFIRMRVETPITLQSNGQTYHGICTDLSSTGMQVELNQPATFSHGQAVHASIVSTHPQLPGLEAEATILRVETLDDGRLALGLKITAIR